MKSTKNAFLMLLVVILCCALVSACSSGTEEPTSATEPAAAQETATEAEAPQVLIRYSYSQQLGEPTDLAAIEFEKEVEEATGGSVQVELYAAGTLASERDSVEGLQMHSIQMANIAGAVATNFVKELGIFSLPMLFNDKEHIYAVLDDIGMDYADLCAEKGLKLMGWFDLGSRNIMTVSQPVNSIDDLKGLKIRTQESPVEMDGMSSFGCFATPMAYNDLYTSLSSSVIDGAEAANTNYVSKAFYEVAPNWAILGWLECVNPIFLDVECWDAMNADQQAAVEAAMANMIKLERELYAQSEEDALEVLIEKGVNITYPEREPFRAAAQAIYDQYASEFGEENISAITNYEY